MPRLTAQERGYDSKWKKSRRQYLLEHPFCVKHLERGEKVAATVVDHIKPHRRDWNLFWDRSNWQPLCKLHHDSLKQREDNRGYIIGCDVSGRPVDPNHPWNRKA